MSRQTSLPYDMGNAGDLLKHGVLAETLRHRLIFQRNQPIRFLDLFAGEPFSSETSDEIIRRVAKLSECALQEGQREIDSGIYYGSGMLVQNLERALAAACAFSLLTATKVDGEGFAGPACGRLRMHFLNSESQPATTHIGLWT